MYQIPSSFYPELKEKISSCVIKPYASTQDIDKARVLMEMNVISFLLEGEKSVSMPEQQVTFQSDQFIVMKQGKCLMTEKLSKEGRYRSLLIFFSNTFLLSFYQKYHLEIPQKNEEKSFTLLPKSQLLNAIAGSLNPYFQQQIDLSAEVARLKAEEILLQIVQQHGATSLGFLFDNRQNYQDIEFQKVVEQNVFNQLTVAELAFICNMSPSTFRRHFIKIYQTPPGQWFTAKRLEKAAQLLKIQQARPSDIYLSIGFESLSSFIHSFKQQYGLTPKQYQLRS